MEDELFRLKRALIHQEREWRDKYMELLNENSILKGRLSEKLTERCERHSEHIEAQAQTIIALRQKLKASKNEKM